MPLLLAVLLALGACAGPGSGDPSRTPGPHVLRGYGHGFPWSGHQQPYVGRP